MIWTVLAVMVYALAAGAAIYSLLVAAWKYTEMEEPWPYVLCGLLWPIAAAPAVGYILAEKKVAQIEEAQEHGSK